MEGSRPEYFILDEVGGTAEAIDNTADTVQAEDCCTVPGCGHWESQHERNHCRVCHTEDTGLGRPEDRKCQHYFFPPLGKDKD
jgi:hypothetical protein